jgi:hypothetical protein
VLSLLVVKIAWMYLPPGSALEPCCLCDFHDILMISVHFLIQLKPLNAGI